jgi:hypothetical protein
MNGIDSHCSFVQLCSFLCIALETHPSAYNFRGRKQVETTNASIEIILPKFKHGQRTSFFDIYSDRASKLLEMSADNSFSTLPAIDISESGETAYSDADVIHGAAQSRPEINCSCPPAPTKYTRGFRRISCELKPMLQTVQTDLTYIRAIRRHTCEQIHENELCPVMSQPGHEELWAALEDIFLQ